MKKIILTLLFVMLAIPSFAQAWHTEAHYDAAECAICGKTIYVYQQASYGADMLPSSGTLFLNAPSCPGERTYTFYTPIKYICPDCERKYSKEFSEHVESFYVDRRFENIKLIEKYQEERRQKRIEDRKKKIIELEKELEELRK